MQGKHISDWQKLSFNSGLTFDCLFSFKVCTIVAEQWCLFKKANFASTELETLGYLPDNSILQKFWHVCEKQLHMSGRSSSNIASIVQ